MVAFRSPVLLSACVILSAAPLAGVAQERSAPWSYRIEDETTGPIPIGPVAQPFTAASASGVLASPACCEPCQPRPPECEACECPACQAQQTEVAKAVAGAYKPLFYNNDFAYIHDPDYDDWYPGDALKQIPLGDCWLVDIGGQYRARYHGERNHRGLGLTGRDDDFLLHRTRLFANARYSDWLRFYAEYIDAESNYENFPPRPIEVNRSDLLNLFADARLLDGVGGDCGSALAARSCCTATSDSFRRSTGRTRGGRSKGSSSSGRARTGTSIF
jgi:hypothetical protein